MSNIDQPAEDCNRNPTANTQNNAAFNGSVSKGKIPVSGGEESEVQLHAADKCNAKIHYLSRTIARQHGVIPSAILTGFAYKLKFHRKNKWKDRWWYYDSIEELRTKRWPYFSDGCLCENIDYLGEKSLLIKDCNNKQSYDRTTWYAMNESVREQALSDLVWFDVAVAKKFKNICPALVYHNLRYHLREAVERDPECPVPYHRLNKAMLARVLPMSQSTAKRWVQELVKTKLFLRHPTKRNLYALADESEYRKIGSSTNANGSSANANRSSTNGSSANANGSSTNANGSTANANGSSANDNTLYETDEKPVTNQSKKGACGVVDNFLSDDKRNDRNKFNDRLHSDHKIISDTVDSIPPREGEDTDADAGGKIALSIDWNKIKSFDQLIKQNQATHISWHLLDEETKYFIEQASDEYASYFAKEFLSPETILRLLDTANRDQILNELRQPFAEYMVGEFKAWEQNTINTDASLWRHFYAPQLETLIRAFNTEGVWTQKQVHTFPDREDEVTATNLALLEKIEAEVSFSAESKTKILKDAVSWYNRDGWKMQDGKYKLNVVQPIKSGFDKIRIIFEKNPHVNVAQVFMVLNNCANVAHLEPVPDGFDKYWAARQGTNLNSFAKYLERIINELDLFSECPISS